MGLRSALRSTCSLISNHSATVYTEHDVAIRYDAGFSALAIVGIAFAVAGFLGLAFLLWLQHLAGVARSRFSGNG